jgi:hypothetical protein
VLLYVILVVRSRYIKTHVFNQYNVSWLCHGCSETVYTVYTTCNGPGTGFLTRLVAVVEQKAFGGYLGDRGPMIGIQGFGIRGRESP